MQEQDVALPVETPEEWLRKQTRDVATEEIENPAVAEAAKPRPKPRAPKRQMAADIFLQLARESVVRNYNEHRKAEKSPALEIAGVQALWFSKTLGHMQAIFCAPRITGIMWEVTFSSLRNEIYIDVYSKLNNIKIVLGDETA